MASNYPTSLDTFTNPTSGDNLDSPDHATQHADANDAVEALEAKVGTGSGTPTSGRVLKGGGTAGSSEWADDVPVSDGTLSVGDLVTVKSLSPLVVEGTPNGTYVARATSKMWCWASDMFGSNGPVTESNTTLGVAGSRQKAWLLDGSTLEGVSGQIELLPGITSIDVYVRWAVPTADSGDCVWQPQYELQGAGTTVSTETNGSQTTSTAGAQNTLVDTKVISALAVGSADVLKFDMLRRGDLAGDTLDAVDVALVGVYAIEA